MDKHLKELLQSLINNSIIVGSWGITNIVIGTHTLSFDVNGFKFSGNVAISFDSNNWTIQIGYQIYHDISLNEVVPFIDNLIESGDDYISTLIQWL